MRIESQIGRTAPRSITSTTSGRTRSRTRPRQQRSAAGRYTSSSTGNPAAGWSAIANGSQDATIVAHADAIKSFGHPMYLAFHHEPENDLDTYGTPAEYAAAFRHVVDVFRARGVTNVAYVWNMIGLVVDPSTRDATLTRTTRATPTSTSSAPTATTGIPPRRGASGPRSARSSTTPTPSP